MATNNNNAAEELETAPELEVVEGEGTSVVEPEEIEALLEEMAKQNEEDDLAAAALAAAEQESAASLEAITESPEVVESELAPSEPESATGPSFTMEDVLRAASESTSFSVDEIKNMESEEAPADLFEEALAEESVDTKLEPEVEPSILNSEQVANTVERAFDDEDSEAGTEEVKSRFKVNLPKFELAGDWKDWLRKPAFIGAAVGLVALIGLMAFMGSKVSNVENKLAAKQKSLESSIEDSKELLENLNERFASMDRSLQSKGPSHSTPVAHKEPSNTTAKPAKPHATKTAVHKPAGDSHKPKVAAHKPKPYATAKPRGPSGDHYDPHALVEGFKTTDLLIAKHSSTKSKHKPRATHAKGKPKPRAKTHVATKTAGSTNGTSMQVYDATGKPIDRITVHAPSGH